MAPLILHLCVYSFKKLARLYSVGYCAIVYFATLLYTAEKQNNSDGWLIYVFFNLILTSWCFTNPERLISSHFFSAYLKNKVMYERCELCG